ncbi:MAG: hypothetical protein JSW73_03555 [Candidatus Woesearchaeota archaeon]|nr:MAG: hypothetical protein JSW73_03555 [Candidatus Woesearchaeota archaeon]
MDKEGCGGKFSIFAILILIIAILWFLADLEVFSANVPWLPLIVIILSIGMLAKHAYYKK